MISDICCAINANVNGLANTYQNYIYEHLNNALLIGYQHEFMIGSRWRVKKEKEKENSTWKFSWKINKSFDTNNTVYSLQFLFNYC